VVPLFNDTPFYLTGGTALSRGYYNHRFSDDLDYFVNYHAEFKRITDIQIEKLAKTFKTKVDLKGENFCRIFVEEKLKIELINDVPSHIGLLITHPVIGLIDSKENIIANKLTAAIGRSSPKDMVDLYFLLKDGFSLKKALLDAGSKAAGILPLLVAKIFAEFPYEIIDNEIKWVTPVSSQIIRKYLTEISLAIVEGRL
jgi:hypothetical protein